MRLGSRRRPLLALAVSTFVLLPLFALALRQLNAADGEYLEPAPLGVSQAKLDCQLVGVPDLAPPRE
jgi:hypothetical protein